jgi:hypothetical protein
MERRPKILKDKLRTLRYNILTILAALLLNSCGENSPDCMKSAGKIIKEERKLPEFTLLEISGNANVILTSDSTSTITVEAGEHLLKKIKTEVSGTKLLISNNNSCNWIRSYKNPLNVYIGIKNLLGIFHYSPGLLSTNGQLTKDTIIIHLYSNGSINVDLNSNYIWLDMDNLGDFKLRGNTHTLLAYVLGLGQLNSEAMSCKELYITGKGQGDAFVRSDSSLVAYLQNSGHVYYSGTPSVIGGLNTGTGSLIKK